MGKYNIVDLFCGAGGLSLGFTQTGRFQIVGAIDNWDCAVDTFRHNHPRVTPEAIVLRDANFINSPDFEKSLQRTWETNGPVDVVMGGPPCQGLSLAGKRLSGDRRNQLFRSFVTAVEKLRPAVFVMENVPGLLSMQGGRLNEAIINAFTSIGYVSFTNHLPTVLKAEQYGVPQLRRRLFYIGFSTECIASNFQWPPQTTHEVSPDVLGGRESPQLGFDLALHNDGMQIVPTVREAISDLPVLTSGDGSDEMEYPQVFGQLTPYQTEMREWPANQVPMVFNHEAPAHTMKLISMISACSPGKSVDPKYTDSKKWDPDRPSFTVKALGSGGGSTNRRAFHYDERSPRGSTVRENARIQSFPDWYRFIGPKTHQMTQVGNAVPPMLARAIAQVIAAAMDASKSN